MASWTDRIKEGIFGSEGKYESAALPEQQQAYQQILQQGQQQLQNPYAGFDPIAQQAQTKFQTQTVPSIAERFTAFGGDNRGSSAFNQSLASAGTGLQENLAAMRAQYGMDNQRNALDTLQLGLSQPTQYREGQQGILGSIGGNLLNAGVNYATGGLSGLAQSALGSIGSLFAPKEQGFTGPYAPGYQGQRQAGYQQPGQRFAIPYAPGYNFYNSRQAGFGLGGGNQQAAQGLQGLIPQYQKFGL